MVWTLIAFVLCSSFHFYSAVLLCSTKTKIHIHAQTSVCKFNLTLFMKCILQGHARFSFLWEEMDGHMWNASVFFNSLQWVLRSCVNLYSFAIRVFAGGKQSARQQRLATTFCFHLHYKAKYQPRLTPPCKTFTPRYQFCVITSLCLFDVSARSDLSAFVLLIFVSLTEYMAPYEGWEERGCQSKAVIHWESSFWKEIKTQHGALHR